ncbi:MULTISPECIES: transporter substrate-binding domain-containing protein [Bacillus]|uniref:Putative ABC transporter extracellular-binding protein YckB n=2 Tax=Bacillus safensis TaxID=561879 RepID=A0A5C0WG01_BACIA|nr:MULTISPECIES: transporter substrate-binding domain-containing protein [Bacillus]KAB3538105.1 transporter substrate-binding domain-containing protein [Bacillus safensis]KAB3543906.1 transporter substrate-binding domain-containing protein [Bacillus safensis]KIZ55098.1 amino acid ABC transporter substrate-binding protein [Bacillus safensis]MBG9820967.1 amino acid ABC transporter substrate-binding protein [Bacillus safensis]MBI1629883.1 transporter substrate-binding domain-containing protein [B
MSRFYHKKPIWIMLVVSAFMLIMSACSQSGSSQSEDTKWDQIKKKGKIVVATSGTLYPTSYHDTSNGKDQLTGYEVEVVKEAFKRLDVKVEFKEMGYDGMLSAINSGQVDAAANDIDITDDRKDKFAFSTPYKYSYGTAIVRKDDLSGIKTLKDLKGKKAAGAATTIYMDVARKYGAKEVIYDNATNEQYLKDVANGRTDVILNDYYLQTLALAAFPKLNITIHPDLKYMPNEQGFVMKKDNKELQKELNRVLGDMKKDGTMKKISEKFFNHADVSKKIDADVEDVDISK